MITLTPELKEQLRKVQINTNNAMNYVEDIKQFRIREHWALPTGEKVFRGDCEDFALLKILRLMELGWDRRELKLTTCWVEPGNGDSYHCVLTVDTDEGTYVLDINFNDIILWNRCGYKWHKREKPGEGWELIPL